MTNEERLPEQYLEADLSIIERLLILPFDIFLKISDTKYIKVFRKGTAFSMELLQEYQEKKKIRTLYIASSDLTIFVKSLSKQVDEIKAQKIDPPAEARRYVQAVHNSVISISQRMGFTPELQSIAAKNIKSVLSVIGTNPDLKLIIASLTDDEKAEIGLHSVVLANIACALAVKIKWNSALTFSKITSAAMFHDISLNARTRQEYDHLQTVATKSLGQKGSLPESLELKEYLNHPNKAAELLVHFQELPPQVDRIIREHHERPDGSGFPNHLKWHEISPLGALLIFAHDLMDFMVHADPKKGLFDFVHKNAELYQHGDFKKIVEELTQTNFSTFKKTS